MTPPAFRQYRRPTDRLASVKLIELGAPFWQPYLNRGNVRTHRRGGEATWLTAQILSSPETEFMALRSLWEKAKFRLRPLHGHSDIVTCVAAVDSLVVSGR